MTGLVKINPAVIPIRSTLSRATRSSRNTNETLFVPKKCKTTTYQRSFFIHTVRIWTALANDIGLSVTISFSSFMAHLLSYYKQSLCKSYDPEDPRSFKSICTSCNKARNLTRNIVVATNYSLTLLQFLFQFYVFRARSNWRELMRSPCLYCISNIFGFVYVIDIKLAKLIK